MKSELKIGLAGIGVVGGAVYEILTQKSDFLNKKSLKNLCLIAVSSRHKKDFLNNQKVRFYKNALDLANDSEIDVIIETIGGSEGIAYQLCLTALKNKKHFITANKALIAIHGEELAQIAQENNVALCFEAAVASSIPILKSIREGFVANKIDKIYAILNGTCNYILGQMAAERISFDEALKIAQKLGYAEADPTFDINGIDSAHKLAILAALAQNSLPDFKSVYIEGIRKITTQDIELANELGYKIKLLGIFEDLGNRPFPQLTFGEELDGESSASSANVSKHTRGSEHEDSTEQLPLKVGLRKGSNKIRQSVYPCLIKANEKLATIDDVYNGILLHTDNCDWQMQIGHGAGGEQTASAIIADLIDVASSRFSHPFSMSFESLSKSKTVNIDEIICQYYLRFYVPSEFARENNLLKEIFGDENIIEQAIIREIRADHLIYALKISARDAKEMKNYLQKIMQIKAITNINIIRIEELNSNI